MVAFIPIFPSCPALRTILNPYLAFAHGDEFFYSRRAMRRDSSAAIIAKAQILPMLLMLGPTVMFDEAVEIGRNAVLASFVRPNRGAKIVDDSISHSHAIVREFCRLATGHIA